MECAELMPQDMEQSYEASNAAAIQLSGKAYTMLC